MKEKTSICFLRAINVAGNNLIRMSDIMELFKRLGFTNVETCLQSGNVIFSYNEELTESELKSLIVTGIQKKFGLDSRVVFRNKTEIGNILKGNSFLNNENADTEKLYVTLLEDHPGDTRVPVSDSYDFQLPVTKPICKIFTFADIY